MMCHAGRKLLRKLEQDLSDGSTDQEDVDLLMEICPPEPIEDWERIIADLEKEYGYLKMLFRYHHLRPFVR